MFPLLSKGVAVPTCVKDNCDKEMHVQSADVLVVAVVWLGGGKNGVTAPGGRVEGQQIGRRNEYFKLKA